ncbi:ArsR/SmtB family transcription factor [Serratia sp. IR-2025]|uniref:ArsR/SmtB family transcription factor n=1 Tax=Enterobacterales TaxID=91347 RepID=UPI0007455DB3|nr:MULTISPECIES: metalloregulator ArsR/SmtB family transcription factor [Enterobacterales]EMC3653738.1 helix-turn-helix transcriptional regulator [Citrobacter braakii]MBA7930220.1 helix-turn-helix transcriptional regulator [Klebsiella sp. RHBSTW-00215]CUY89588.1 Helix-turn-helix domain [Serratia marcescens]HEJ7301788.1 helix-turn-helix transcriptional regulator [Serratia marcescens]HEJ8047094.1 helix-turn-helix transcriptional regulator [Serratia marcescens]
MNINIAAEALKELGHPTRLSVFKELVKFGYEGLPVGELQKRLEIPASTLSHHLSALLSVGLIRQERQGRILYCQPQYALLSQIINFLLEECCVANTSCSSVTTSTLAKTEIPS